MNKLDTALQELKKEGKMGLMTHVVIGYPTLEKTISLVKTMVKSGADIIELQIPFSDPLADGPTIMRACELSLKNGTKVKDAFIIAKELSKVVSIPVLFMAYYNTVFQYGVEEFCKDSANAGMCGLIVPDMPIEEESEEHFFAMCKKYNLHAIHVVSPASTDERLKINAKVATGFIYATARQGITGARGKLDEKIEKYLKNIKNVFTIPIAVGFGISKKEHIETLSKYADVAIIGSALIEVVASKGNYSEKDIATFLTELSSE